MYLLFLGNEQRFKEISKKNLTGYNYPPKLKVRRSDHGSVSAFILQNTGA
jgi:hypothetical protein